MNTYTLTIDNSDKAMQRTYKSLEQAVSVAERAKRLYKASQNYYGNHVQVLNYIAIDENFENGKIEYDVFYFDGSKHN